MVRNDERWCRMLKMTVIDKERGKLHEKRKVARKEESCKIWGKLQDE